MTGNNLASTYEDGEPTAGTHGARNTVWWSWTAPASETVEISTIGSDIDTVLAIYTGDAVDDLTLIAVNHDIAYPDWLASRIAFNAVAGTTYRIAVDGDLNETGPIVLNLPGGQPENNPPEIADQTFDVDENSAAGTVVGTVAASDPDAGQSLSYAITGGNESGAFAINSATGEISAVAPLNHEANESYVLTVEVTDDGSPALSVAASVTVNVADVNEAPVLDNTGAMALNEIGFGQSNNPGTLVADLIASAGGDRISDPDAGAVEGIAITAANTANGSWQFSTDGGATWQALGAVSTGSARLLAANARVRFQPNLLYSGTITNALTFRAWDQTSGAERRPGGHHGERRVERLQRGDRDREPSRARAARSRLAGAVSDHLTAGAWLGRRHDRRGGTNDRCRRAGSSAPASAAEPGVVSPRRSHESNLAPPCRTPPSSIRWSGTLAARWSVPSRERAGAEPIHRGRGRINRRRSRNHGWSLVVGHLRGRSHTWLRCRQERNGSRAIRRGNRRGLHHLRREHPKEFVLRLAVGARDHAAAKHRSAAIRH